MTALTLALTAVQYTDYNLTNNSFLMSLLHMHGLRLLTMQCCCQHGSADGNTSDQVTGLSHLARCLRQLTGLTHLELDFDGVTTQSLWELAAGLAVTGIRGKRLNCMGYRPAAVWARRVGDGLEQLSTLTLRCHEVLWVPVCSYLCGTLKPELLEVDLYTMPKLQEVRLGGAGGADVFSVAAHWQSVKVTAYPLAVAGLHWRGTDGSGSGCRPWQMPCNCSLCISVCDSLADGRWT